LCMDLPDEAHGDPGRQRGLDPERVLGDLQPELEQVIHRPPAELGLQREAVIGDLVALALLVGDDAVDADTQLHLVLSTIGPCRHARNKPAALTPAWLAKTNWPRRWRSPSPTSTLTASSNRNRSCRASCSGLASRRRGCPSPRRHAQPCQRTPAGNGRKQKGARRSRVSVRSEMSMELTLLGPRHVGGTPRAGGAATLAPSPRKGKRAPDRLAPRRSAGIARRQMPCATAWGGRLTGQSRGARLAGRSTAVSSSRNPAEGSPMSHLRMRGTASGSHRLPPMPRIRYSDAP
jgi:hypothetical protein